MSPTVPPLGVFMPSVPAHFRPSRRRFAVAAPVLAACLAIGLLTGPSTSAQSERLDEVRADQDEIRAQLDDQNAAIDSLLGEVAALRVREDRVAGELAEQEAELAEARSQLVAARDALIQTRHRLKGALDELEQLLVRIYRYGEPDELTVFLNSDGYDELATTETYFERIRDYQSGVVGRVRDLRSSQRAAVDQIEASVDRMEAARAAIAERQQALADSRAALEAREADLQAAQAERREQLRNLAGQEKDLLEALSTPPPTPEAAAESETAPAPAANVPAPTGPSASVNSDGTATAPADAPQVVKDVIAAGNQITNMPYLYGGGHGSFEASGYDCSGSVSYALHGGGLLSSPLDSTGFMTWGESGPGQWITVYSNPGHAYMVVAGLRFDTSGAPPRWQASMRDPAGYVATHPPGY
jgi:septal ring factor EnvC (AmiA/AmiB activator)